MARAFDSIKKGLQEAIAHQKGKALGVKTHKTTKRAAKKPLPPSVPHEPWLVERLKNPKMSSISRW